MVGKNVTLEIKNGMKITGTLHSVDHFLNFKIENIEVENIEDYPHMVNQKYI